MKHSIKLAAFVVACIFAIGAPRAFAGSVVGAGCNASQLGTSEMTSDGSEIATCLYDNPNNNPAGIHWKVPGEKGVTAYEIFNACPLKAQNLIDCFFVHDIPTNLFISPGGVQPSITCGVLAANNQGHAVSVGVHTVDPVSGAIGFAVEYSTILYNKGSAQESEQPLISWGILILGNSGYSQRGGRQRLDQTAGVARLPRIPARNR